ncbi:MAG: sigma-70 family RNA polymerase sigma factor [Polyangiaceae bacterium]|nr:sigma-70 family RNA polymerase sigma factor [Polyangiaceae bacterium]
MVARSVEIDDDGWSPGSAGQADLDAAADLERGDRGEGRWPGGADEARFRAIRDAHFELVWRSVRRLGVPEADADDAVQQVFIVAARRLQVIRPGSERAFLFATALRVAWHARRSRQRRGEVAGEAREALDGAPSPEELMDQRRARALLDEALEALPLDARAVFILFELEEMTQSQIAALLELPPGTVASRLRRGREEFQAAIARIKARAAGPRGPGRGADLPRRAPDADQGSAQRRVR